jgi:hypothetical protein
MRNSNLLYSALALTSLVFTTGMGGCNKKSDVGADTTLPTRYLYVASGACYGGGATLSTGAGTVVRYNLTSGASDVLADYTTVGTDLPAGIADWDSDNILVTVEIAGARRIEIVNKRGLGRYTLQSNPVALSAQLRTLTRLSDGGFLVSKSSAIERFNSAGGRSALAPYINAPAGACATSTTLISATSELNNGKLLFAHATASPNNKIGVISANGYAVAADCLASQAAPVTTSLPSAMVYLSDIGQLLVGYGSAGATASSNQIWSYPINETTPSFGAGTAAWTNFNVVNGPSAMAYDLTTGYIYVANALSTLNNIEKFTFNASTKVLTRVGTSAAIPPSIYTRCISGMVVGY